MLSVVSSKKLLATVSPEATSSWSPTDDAPKVDTIFFELMVSVCKVIDMQRMDKISSLRKLLNACVLCIMTENTIFHSSFRYIEKAFFMNACILCAVTYFSFII